MSRVPVFLKIRVLAYSTFALDSPHERRAAVAYHGPLENGPFMPPRQVQTRLTPCGSAWRRGGSPTAVPLDGRRVPVYYDATLGRAAVEVVPVAQLG